MKLGKHITDDVCIISNACMLGVTDLGYGISETVLQMENPLQQH